MTIETILPRPNIFDARRVLCIQPHYDDNDIAAAEAVIFAGLTRIPSSNPVVDSTYKGRDIKGIVFYYTREPNHIMDISSAWEGKIAAVRCYEAQFDQPDMDRLMVALDAKSQQVAQGESFARGEALKVLHTSALHCGF